MGVSSPARFWSKVARAGADDCWPWSGYRMPKGYGRTYFDGRWWLAHRLAYALERDPGLPVGQPVLHSCDNPPCCNPSHLFLGSRADNNADMDAKGRRGTVAGSAHGRAVLTPELGQALAASYAAGEASLPELARAYGIGVSTAHRVARGEHWTTRPSGLPPSGDQR